MVCVNKHSSAFRKLRRQTEIRTAQIVVTLILVYLTAWTPYAIVTLIGQFGSEESQLTPIATAIPAYFAKTAVVLDPLVYGFSHPHFRTSLRHYLSNLVVAQQNKSITSLHHGMSVGHSKSLVHSAGGRPTCSYQSRGMTIYPSAFCNARDPYTQGARLSSGNGGGGGVDGGNKRRMLRTFRDLSLNDAANSSSNTMTNINRAAGFKTSGNGVMELCRSYVAVVAIPLDQEAADTTLPVTANEGQTNETASDRPSSTHNSKYKVRNAEFHSEHTPAPTKLTSAINN